MKHAHTYASVKVKLVILLLSAGLIVYNVLRILNVPMTHDEIGIVSQLPSYYDIVTLKSVTANNHILNSILRKFLMETFHNRSPFMMRLDNLLALVLFLYTIYLLLRRLFDKPLWLIGGFLFLVLNPFMFEFWGLSRGYGLSIAFMSASIYCFIAYLQDNRTDYLWLCQLWAILAVYSNFALLNFYVSLAAVIIILLFLFNRENPTRQIIKALPVLLVSTLILYLLVAAPIEALRAHNELYYGGDKGLIQDTLKSLTDSTFRIHTENNIMTWLDNLIVVTIAFACVYWVMQYFRQRDDKVKTGVALLLLFIVPLVAIYLQHQLLHIKYLIDRTALFLIILFKLQLVYLLYYFSLKKIPVAKPVFILLSCLALINFADKMNTYRTWSWWYDCNNIIVLNRMMDQQKGRQGKIKVRTYWLFAPSFMYYTDTKYRQSFYPVVYTHEDIINDTSYDYYYIQHEESATLLKDYIQDTSFYGGAFVLMKRKW